MHLKIIRNKNKGETTLDKATKPGTVNYFDFPEELTEFLRARDYSNYDLFKEGDAFEIRTSDMEELEKQLKAF